MELIRGYFDRYKANHIKVRELSASIMNTSSKPEWLKDFQDSLNKTQALYDENRAIIESLFEICDSLNEDSANTLYEELMKMYFGDYDDAEFLFTFGNKLIDYYIPLNDEIKLIDLYCLCTNYMIYIDSPNDEFDMSYAQKGMSYIDRYLELPAESRYRIHIMNYTYLIRYTDYGVVSLGEALTHLEKYLAFFDREEIKEADKDNEKIRNVIEFTKNAMSIGILKIKKVDEDTRTRFYNYVRDYNEKYFSNIESVYALSAREYSCYLYKCYVEKTLSFDEVFNNFLEYVKFKYQILESKATIEYNDIITCANSVAILKLLCEINTNPNNAAAAVSFLTRFVEGRWIRGDFDNFETINEMLAQSCIIILSSDVPGIDKNTALKQLVVQRNLLNYIKAELVGQISIALYRALSIRKKDFFDSVKSVPKNQWREYLYYASLFHDIGNNDNTENHKIFNRPVFNEKEEGIMRHIVSGREIIKNSPEMVRYDDIINGHHMFYDMSKGVSDNFDRNKSEYKPFVDIIAISAYIEEKTNPYWDFQHKSTSFERLISLLKSEKDRRFNGEIVDVILTSSTLQNSLKKIVTVDRDSVFYDLCHNWEKIQLSEDEESILAQVDKKILDFRVSTDEDMFAPYLKKVTNIAYNSKNEKNRGIAMFYLMRYYFMRGDYTKAFALESDTNRLLKENGLNEDLVKNYLNSANVEVIRENPEAALSKFLSALEVARVTPECVAEENVALAAIATVYTKCGNYLKAKEYFNLVDIDTIDDYEKMKHYCAKAFCSMKLDERKQVEDELKNLLNLLKQNEIFGEISLYAYLAYFEKYLNNEKELDKYLSLIKAEVVTEEIFKYSADEVMIYLELLEELGDFEELNKQLDYYIKLCEGKTEFAQVCVAMISKRMHVFSLETKNEEMLSFEKKLMYELGLSIQERAFRMEEMEKTFMENIKLQSEHTLFLNEKSALEQTVQRAKNESAQKSQFLSSMSHEIRTPINAILGLNEMILRECEDDEILQYATDINNAGKQLLGIVNDVLDYSKIEAGKMEIIPQKYYLGELVNDIKNMIEPKLNEKDLSYIVKCNPEIPNVLFGDDLRIKQILLNLLSNAYKYTNTGYVQFTIDYSKIDDKTIKIAFEVKDSGIGLKKEQIAKLSNPFERFEDENTRGVEGTGLGMSIVTRLLEQMDAKLDVKSKYGEGSTFSFEIIQGVVEWGILGELDDVKRKVLSRNVENKKKSTSVVAPDAKLLVVDDNLVNLKVIQALLKRNKVQVTAASSGKECLELCEKNGYHIIFLDHMMPQMDGLETISRLKKMGGINKDTPVIALTANVTESGDEFYGKAGFDDLLTKPVDIEKLEDVLRKYLPSYLLQ